VTLTFLGQSGFLIEGERRIAFDPFLGPLEDPAERGRFPRLVNPPLSPRDLGSLDAVFVSHHHGDHCHVSTLTEVARINPGCRFVVTPSARDLLLSAGLHSDRLLVPEMPGPTTIAGFELFIVPARHYRFSYRDDVMFDYFGYVLSLDDHRIYFAGDTIEFPGLVSLLRRLRPTIALLPVNGRDEERDAQGIVGNLTLAESVALARTCGFAHVVPCHFGMFAANTVAVNDIAKAFAGIGSPDTHVWIPRPGERREVA